MDLLLMTLVADPIDKKNMFFADKIWHFYNQFMFLYVPNTQA